MSIKLRSAAARVNTRPGGLHGGGPLVWFQTQQLLNATSVTWQDNYQGFTSPQDIQQGTAITPGFEAPMDLGQILVVTDSSGSGDVEAGGPEGGLSGENEATSTFAVGHAKQPAEGAPGLVVAFPLESGQSLEIEPVETVLLAFVEGGLTTGVVVLTAPASGYLVDVSGASSGTRQVSFDIDQGWSCDGCSWAPQVTAGTQLSSLLIQQAGAFGSPRSTRDLSLDGPGERCQRLVASQTTALGDRVVYSRPTPSASATRSM